MSFGESNSLLNLHDVNALTKYDGMLYQSLALLNSTPITRGWFTSKVPDLSFPSFSFLSGLNTFLPNSNTFLYTILF